MTNLKPNNLKTLNDHIRVAKWMNKERAGLLDAAKAEAAAGIGIQEDTMDSFLFLEQRLTRYTFKPAND